MRGIGGILLILGVGTRVVAALFTGGPGAAALDNFWCERQDAGPGAARRT